LSSSLRKIPLSTSDCNMRATVGTGRRLSKLIWVRVLGPARATMRRTRTARSITWIVMAGSTSPCEIPVLAGEVYPGAVPADSRVLRGLN
jgi:hypothetical protein